MQASKMYSSLAIESLADWSHAPLSRITVTGRLTRKLLAEPKKGPFYAYFYLKGARRRHRGSRARTVAVGPKMPGRPFLHWKVAKLCGFHFTRAPDVSAELAVRFDTATWSAADNNALFRTAVRIVNGGCPDISKDRVSQVFKSVFGCSCDLDPLTHSGPMVVKSNANAAHDGRVVTGPFRYRDPRMSYQRVIDNEVTPGMVEDLRICVVGSELPYLLRKFRPLSRRFENYTERTEVVDPTTEFSQEEISRLLAFAHAFGLDFGEVDIVRDRGSGLIYVLDVNTTPHSPPDSLISFAGIECMERAAVAFGRQFLT